MTTITTMDTLRVQYLEDLIKNDQLFVEAKQIKAGRNNQLCVLDKGPFQPNPLCLKRLISDHPTASRIVQLRNESRITQVFEAPEIRKGYGQIEVNSIPVLLFEYLEGETLEEKFLKADDDLLSLPQFLSLAIEICRPLEIVHHNRIIHKDINPHNFMVTRDGKVSLIDFGISSQIDIRESQNSLPENLEGTLPYMSPEQTGRMNRPIDYRSDIYSLGVTLYQLLTGHLPFDESEPAAWIYAHLAQIPPAPDHYRTDLPPTLSEIIIKLLAKNGEERYQSVRGLRKDLEVINQQLQSDSITHFDIGKHDFTGRLNIPQKLYGRDSERQQLLDLFDEMIDGKLFSPRLVLVSGYSGVGKSALIGEIHKPLGAKGGIFVSGKFDQFQRNIPYSGFTQALTELCQFWLTLSGTQLTVEKEKILNAVGSNGQLLIDLIPLIERVIGPQPLVPEMPSTEAQNRFNSVLQQFVRVICSSDRPLACFIDDLQWADNSSLSLIQNLSVQQIPGFQIIGAYRDNEVNRSHPLMMMLDDFETDGGDAVLIHLDNLMVADVTVLLADTLNLPLNVTKPLAELVHLKTLGNPFFTRAFIQSLYLKQLLVFSRADNCWVWDIEKIEEENITENVVELIADQLSQLEEPTQELLMLAACIGNRFNLETLAMLAQMEAEPTLSALWPALRATVVLPIDESYKRIGLDQANPAFTFPHDRVQQAAYALIKEEERRETHLKIGKTLLEDAGEHLSGKRLFDIVNHFNQAQALFETVEDRIQLAKFNLQAGRASQESAAYSTTLAYYKTAFSLVPLEIWTIDYDFSLDLHLRLYDVYRINAKSEEAEVIFEQTMQNVSDSVDQATLYNLAIVHHTLQGRYPEAVALSLEGLRKVGVYIPEENRGEAIGEQMAEINVQLEGRDILDLVDLPLITDRTLIQQLNLVINAVSPAIFIDPELFTLITCYGVNLALKHGNTPEIPYTYACYGLFTSAALKQFEYGRSFGQLAINVAEKLNSGTHHCRTMFLFGHTMNHFRRPLIESLDYGRKAYLKGVETGDIQFAGYGLWPVMTASLYSGRPLDQAQNEIEKAGIFVQETGNQLIYATQQVYTGYLASLQNGAQENERTVPTFDTEAQTEAELLGKISSEGMALGTYFINKGITLFLHHYPEEALAKFKEAEAFLGPMMGIFITTELVFYRMLARIMLIESQESETIEELLLACDADIETMAELAQSCPENFEHKHLLMLGERAKIQGAPWEEVINFYDLAISSAQQNGFIQNVALANQLAGRFWITHDKTKLAKPYIEDSYFAYELWGASSITDQLTKSYPEWFSNRQISSMENVFDTRTAGTHSFDANQMIDLGSLAEAYRTVSEEIVLDQLIEKLMRVMLENAGAESGVLLLQTENVWRVEALLDLEKGQCELLIDLLKDDAKQMLPIGVVNYVIHTGEMLLLDDATTDIRFAHDIYIAEMRPQSVIALPLIIHGQVNGVVYLQNRQNASVFTPERAHMLKLLSAQAAITIDKARLYMTLEQQVTDRTAELYEVNLALEEERIHLAERIEERTADLTKANIELRQLSQVKDEFLANMSHELRTPLNAIIGYSEGLIEELEEEEGLDTEIYIDDAQRIRMAGRTLLSIINDVLDIAKIEANESVFSPTLFSIDSLVSELQDTIDPMVIQNENKLLIHNNLSGQYIRQDRQKVSQILLNLLSNAVKFTRQGIVTLEITNQANKLIFSVGDTGFGIPQEAHKQIFEPFHQVDNSMARTYGGTGLGLAICQRFSKIIGGTLELESEIGQGSIFRLCVDNSVDFS